jgi:predicted Zn finger-like uncharacterized protein
MKIICDNCGAKYSIADEKVRGKVFKIRCKKCSEIIVVRGTVGAEAEAEASTGQPAAEYSGFDAATAAIWHVVIDGDQQGPYTATQIADYVTAGQLDYDTYCWRDGFSDWMHFRDIEELAGLVQGGAPGVQSPAYPSDGGADQGYGAAYGQDDGSAAAYQESGPVGGAYDQQPAAADQYQYQGMDQGGYAHPTPDVGGYGGYQGAEAAGYGEQTPDMSGYGQSADAGAQGYGFTAPASTDQDQGALANLFGGEQHVATVPGHIGQPEPTPGFGAGFMAPSASELAARGGGHGAGADLFAEAQEEGGMFPAGGGGLDVMTSSPRVDVSRMTGTRNENSVLFSLSNLQALASGAAAPHPGPVAPAGMPRVGPQASGTTEGSGLIDIKAMASAIDTSEPTDGVDDLLSIGGGGGFAPTLGAPVLVAAPREKSSGLLIAVIGIGSALLLGVIALVIVILWPRPPEPASVAANQPVLSQPAVPGLPGVPTPAVGVPATPAPPLPGTPAPEGAGGESAAPAPGEEGGTDPGAGGGDGATDRDRRRDSKRVPGAKAASGDEPGGGAAAAIPTPAPGPSKAEAPATNRGGRNDLDSLLDQAISPGAAPSRPVKAAQPEPTPGGGGDSGGNAGGESIPQKLDRGAVRSGMNRVAGRVARCGNGQAGRVTVDVVIEGSSGRVTDVTVTGEFAGTPVGSCAARAIRGARFSRFRDASLTVRGYPFPVN